VIRKRYLFGIICPIVLYFIVIALDLNLYTLSSDSLSQAAFRELLFGLIIDFFVWGTSSLVWFQNRTLLQKLRFFGIAVILIWVGKKLVSVFGPSSKTDTVFSMPYLVLFFGILFFLVWIWNTLKELIFIQRGKRTQTNFRLLLIFIYLVMIYTFVHGIDIGAVQWNLSDTSDTVFRSVFYGIVIFMAMINGFRCKWIHYLKKQQKVGFFFFFLVINFFLGDLLFSAKDTIQSYSPVFGTFYQCLIFVCATYSGMALLGILFLLPSAGMMDRRLQVIQSLQTLSATIGSVFEKDELAAKTVELARKVVNADCTWIELKIDTDYQLAGFYSIREEEVGQIPDAVRKSIRREGREIEDALLINDLSRDQRTREIRRWKRKAGSLLAAPLRFKEKDLGMLYALKAERYGFVEESRGLFRAFADQVAVALENSNLIQVTIDQEVYREELRVAHEAQMRILPQTMPVLQGVELDAFCLTANEIGGDFYDVIQVNDERLDIVIGDVSGKGPNAAFYMAELKGVIQALAPLFSSPKQILLEMNKFAQNHFEADTFATIVYGIFTPKKKQIELVRAGHPPVGLIRRNNVTWLETEGVGLGLASNAIFSRTLKKKMIQLQKGDIVFFHTDGLMEARDSQGEEFGEVLLTEILLQMGNKGAAEVLAEVRGSMERFTAGVSRHDDVTLLALGLV
jgi:sigma-B regulation protein RsbU (phosphoserine phosphatase)